MCVWLEREKNDWFGTCVLLYVCAICWWWCLQVSSQKDREREKKQADVCF